MNLIDVSLFRKTKPFYEQVFADELDSGRVVTGTEKIAQRFILELLTVTDSVPQLTAGCAFITRLATGTVTNESDVFVIFVSVLNTVVMNLKALETEDDPNEERLSSIKIESLTVAEASLNLNLRIQTAAGTTQNISIPLQFLLS